MNKMIGLFVMFTLFAHCPAESKKYMEEGKQFQLHTLLTEQRHPKTMHLSSVIQDSTVQGIRELLSVDEDISAKFLEMSKETALLEKASQAIQKAILTGNKIYLYGCGATGRLAKQVESSFWRPFWRKTGELFPNIENRLIGEMTGADRALISSLEGFEDLQMIGEKQLQEHGIGPEDVVFAISEGGETSSVIGAILAAERQGGDDQHLFFIFNNPPELLIPFDRSRQVLENPNITKLCLATGPQSIAGSTRMQATTSETFVMGILLEDAIAKVLDLDGRTIKDRLLDFIPIQKAVIKDAEWIAQLTDLEAKQPFTTYFAKDALMTVFTDCTERSPTFRLPPLDTLSETVRKCRVQVCTDAKTQQEAWLRFLGRPFHGLDYDAYAPFLNTALPSLLRAGDDQQYLYDFSFMGKIGDPLVIAVLIGDENSSDLPIDFCDAVQIHGSKYAPKDPFLLRQHIALKMVLNAHSTGVMAKLGKVSGNTMTHVNPGNLKLIGRATFLIQNHVNDHLFADQAISYADANEMLFEAITYVLHFNKVNIVPEVPLTIIKILEDCSWEMAEKILLEKGLNGYLK